MVSTTRVCKYIHEQFCWCAQGWGELVPPHISHFQEPEFWNNLLSKNEANSLICFAVNLVNWSKSWELLNEQTTCYELIWVNDHWYNFWCSCQTVKGGEKSNTLPFICQLPEPTPSYAEEENRLHKVQLKAVTPTKYLPAAQYLRFTMPELSLAPCEY